MRGCENKLKPHFGLCDKSEKKPAYHPMPRHRDSLLYYLGLNKTIGKI